MTRVEVLAKLHRLSETVQEEHDRGKQRWSENEKETFHKLHALKLPHSGRKMLSVLYAKGGMNQRALALQLGISPQAVSESVKKLEHLGYIIKENGSQKNENLISLTEEGGEMAKFLIDLIGHHASELFRTFSDDEVQQLGVLLDKLMLNVLKE